MFPRVRIARVLAACLLAAALGGCGSSSDDKTTSASAASVQVTSPADGSAVKSDRITVRGTVTPSDATVLVVGQPAQVGNGVFTIAIPVHKGQNTIDVVASGKGVTPASTKITVTRTSSTGTKKSARRDSGTRSTSGPVLAGARNCGSGVTAGANTSCPFAQNVVEAYAATGSGVLDVRSPVTGQTYRMFCTGGVTHVCTGGNNASVYFGSTGNYSLGNCGNGLSAGPNTSCGFAENVRAAYRSSGSSVVTAFSPATGRSYTMYCTTSSPHVCTGGTDAAVYFP
jgi:Glucodextranase, domain B